LEFQKILKEHSIPEYTRFYLIYPCGYAPIGKPFPLFILYYDLLDLCEPMTTNICTHSEREREYSLEINFLKIIHLFTCAYIVWVISLPCPLPYLFSPSLPQFQVGPVLPLSLILLKKRHKHNKEDKEFLLVELRIAVQRDS
jgi:hypothetical protein